MFLERLRVLTICVQCCPELVEGTKTEFDDVSAKVPPAVDLVFPDELHPAFEVILSPEAGDTTAPPHVDTLSSQISIQCGHLAEVAVERAVQWLRVFGACQQVESAWHNLYLWHKSSPLRQ